MKKKNIAILLTLVSSLYAQDMEKIKNEEIFNKLTNEIFTSNNVTAETNYQHGLAAYNLGNTSIAIASFERAINENPEITDAQIKLAECYGKSGLIESAINEYSKILNNDKFSESEKKTAKENLKNLELKESKWDFSGKIGLSFYRDSNVNYAANNRTFDTVFMFPIEMGVEKKSAYGVSAEAEFDIAYNLFADKESLLQAFGNAQIYQSNLHDASEYDLTYLNFSTGLRYFRKKYLFELALKNDILKLESDTMLRSYGIEPQFVYLQRKDLIHTIKLTYEDRHYLNNSFINKSDFYSLAYGITKIFSDNNRNYVGLIGKYFKEKASSDTVSEYGYQIMGMEENTMSNHGWQLKALCGYELINNLQIYGEVAYLCSKYEGNPFYYLTDDNRKDREKNLTIGLRKFFNENFYLDFSYNYTIGESNTDIFDFTRHVFATSLIYKF